MKKLVLASSLLFAGAAFAQQEPATTPQPAPREVQLQVRKAEAAAREAQLKEQEAEITARMAQRRMLARQVNFEKGTWLGISSAPLAPQLRQKLALPRGLGLQIAQVEPGSPAEKAGLAPQDLLLRVNDQQLFNEAQLRSLIRTFKAGDEVKLNIVSGDKPMSLTASLVERDMPAIDNFVVAPMPPFMGGGGGIVGFRGGQGRVEHMMRVDADGVTIQVNGDAKGRHIKATGPDGKILFDGPIDTEEMRKAMPPDIRKRVEDMGIDARPAADFNVTVRQQPEMPMAGINGNVTFIDEIREQKIDWSDGDVDLTLTIKRNGKEVETHLLVKDDTGRKLFEGPVDTREQRGNVPVNLQDKLLQALLKNFQEAGGTLNPIRIRLDAPQK